MAGESGRCMQDGCIFCYDGWDCSKIICCCMGSGDCLCIRNSCCLAVNAKSRGFGCVGDKDRGEICKIALFCCDYGLIWPTKICACANQCLCCYDVASLPWSKEYVGKPVCAYCFIQCCPTCGCCAAPPDCPALDKIAAGELITAPLVSEPMDRGKAPAGGNTSVTETTFPDGSKKVITTTTNPDGSQTTTEKIIPAAASLTPAVTM